MEISSGGRASPGPVTLICRSTVSPTVTSELLNTAVTLGESARAICAMAITAKNASKIRRCITFPSTTNHQPLPIVIDMTLYFAFIKSDSRLFVLHRFKQRQRLAFAHLAFFFLFSFRRHLLVFIGGLL